MPAQEKLSVQTVNQHIVTKIFPQLSPAVRSKAPSKIDSHLLSKDVSCPSAHSHLFSRTALWGRRPYQSPAEHHTMDFQAESDTESPTLPKNSLVSYCIAEQCDQDQKIRNKLTPSAGAARGLPRTLLAVSKEEESPLEMYY